MDDRELIRDFVERRSQEAFRQIVERHLPMVLSTARRLVCDTHLAEEVAQSVFTTLAQKAESIRPPQVIGGWLYNTARHLALHAVRTEQRRREREQTAFAMQTFNLSQDDPHITEHLEPAMAELDDADRDALVLRFLENRSLRDVGTELGLSEDAARMRVNRALERLRAGFGRRDVAVTTVLLATALTATTTAVPAALTATIAMTALATMGISASAGVGTAAGVASQFWQLTRTKLVAGLATTVVIGIVTLTLFQSSKRTPSSADEVSPATPGLALNSPAIGAATQNLNALEEPREPDPLKLLQTVARARQRITSGSLELQIFVDRIEGGRTQTNHQAISILFDESKRRFDARMREYSYVPLGSDDSAGAKETNRLADSMDNEAAVRAGLLRGFEAHLVTASAGETFLRFRESDGQGGSTTIDDNNNGGSYFFDPRCLGLSDSLHPSSTIEACLAYDGAKAIKLLGEESVDGIPAWHVFVQTKYDVSFDFWIDAAHPERLLKYAHGAEMAVSKYDDFSPGNPIPTEVTTRRSYRNGAQVFLARYVRSATQLNGPVAPASFTLAGLGMPIGTVISDQRNHRIIGYWNGTGFNDGPLRKGAEPQRGPDPAALSDLLENYPSSSDALEAAQWIISNTPDGPEVEKAARVIRQEHLQNTNLIKLCIELERLRHRCSTNLLEALLKNNPSVDVQGTACFALATLAKEEAHYGTNKNATARAEKLLEEVIAKFPRVKQRGYNLADLAKPELNEVRHLFVGHPAPEIEGEDLDGQPLKLSDYRGKVVVLTFWWPGYYESVEHRKLAERMEGKPFACLGVYGDDDLAQAKADVEKYGINWPSFRDKRGGPISTNWHVRSWPHVWVLDAHGTIRHRNLRGGDLVNAVETLLRE